jgi:hypothetical protein
MKKRGEKFKYCYSDITNGERKNGSEVQSTKLLQQPNLL